MALELRTSMSDVTTKDPISLSLKVSMASSLEVIQVSVGNLVHQKNTSKITIHLSFLSATRLSISALINNLQYA